jgi:hypothetical protein|eukprot:scaffold3640_cov201-Alexandrium_tamarense.AAC.15
MASERPAIGRRRCRLSRHREEGDGARSHEVGLKSPVVFSRRDQRLEDVDLGTGSQRSNQAMGWKDSSG